MLGLEVDSVEELFADLDQIVSARVTAVSKHPDADKLTVCEVDDGWQHPGGLWCAQRPGRHGFGSGPPGVKLPDGTKIKKAKVRGVASAGMLCSSRELGLNQDHGGILDLDAQLEPGRPLAEALNLRDTMIEVDLTPNRPDCASVRGIAARSAVSPTVRCVRWWTG